MQRRFVIDSSVTLAWLFNEDAAGARIEAALAGAELVAPWLWRLEVVNVILIRERRKQLNIAQSTQLLELLQDWAVEIVGDLPSRSLAELAGVARPYQLTAYDAVYLELAVSLGLPLFTRDGNLRDAAVRIGVPLIAEA